jgi:hypothetical protein
LLHYLVSHCISIYYYIAGDEFIPFECGHIETKIRNAKSFNKNFVEGLLEGATLRVGALDASVERDTSRIKNYYVQVWEQLARVGNFTVQWVFVPPKRDESSTEYLLRYVDEVDVIGGVSYFDTPSRRQRNLVYVRNPGPRLDLVLIGRAATVQYPTSIERMTTFLKPFSPQLWGVLGFGIVFSAFVMYFFEHGDVDGSEVYNDPQKGLFERLFISLWMDVCMFTGPV